MSGNYLREVWEVCSPLCVGHDIVGFMHFHEFVGTDTDEEIDVRK
jgi:hypothetical protein